jgi:hypothetical protein
VASPTPVEGGPGGRNTLLTQQISSSSDLERELGISVDAKAGIGLFRGSARIEFAEKCRIQAYSVRS